MSHLSHNQHCPVTRHNVTVPLAVSVPVHWHRVQQAAQRAGRADRGHRDGFLPSPPSANRRAAARPLPLMPGIRVRAAAADAPRQCPYRTRAPVQRGRNAAPAPWGASQPPQAFHLPRKSALHQSTTATTSHYRSKATRLFQQGTSRVSKVADCL